MTPVKPVLINAIVLCLDHCGILWFGIELLVQISLFNSRCVVDEELNTLYNDRLTNITGKMLLMASPASEDTISRPFHTIDSIVHSVRKLLEGYQEEAIWTEVSLNCCWIKASCDAEESSCCS